MEINPWKRSNHNKNRIYYRFFKKKNDNQEASGYRAIVRVTWKSSMTLKASKQTGGDSTILLKIFSFVHKNPIANR
jgi:hypothetical protein